MMEADKPLNNKAPNKANLCYPATENIGATKALLFGQSDVVTPWADSGLWIN